MKNKKCLLITSPYSWGGGIKTMIDEAFKSLELAQYKVDLLIPLYPNTYKAISSAIYIETPSKVNFNRLPLIHHLYFGFKVRKLARNYDHLFAVVATSHTSLPFALSGKKFSLWVATTYADELESKYESLAGDRPAKRLRNSIQWIFLEFIEKFVFRRASRIFALSEHTKKKIMNLDGKLSDKITVLNPPIDVKLFSKKNIKKHPKSIIFTGRWKDPRKNIYLLFKSLSLIKKRIPNIKLTLVGGTMDLETKRILIDLDIFENVNFVSNVDRKKIPEFLNRNDLFVCTAIQEGLGISILEAMACGLPVVVTKCGGPESIIEESNGGILVNFSDHEIAMEVTDLLKNKNKRKQIGENGSSFISEHLSYEVFVNKIVSTL